MDTIDRHECATKSFVNKFNCVRVSCYRPPSSFMHSYEQDGNEMKCVSSAQLARQRSVEHVNQLQLTALSRHQTHNQYALS